MALLLLLTLFSSAFATDFPRSSGMKGLPPESLTDLCKRAFLPDLIQQCSLSAKAITSHSCPPRFSIEEIKNQKKWGSVTGSRIAKASTLQSPHGHTVEFVQEYKDLVEWMSDVSLIPAEVVMGQIKAESGWGRSYAVQAHNNFLGLGCGGSYSPTIEYPVAATVSIGCDRAHNVAHFDNPRDTMAFYIFNYLFDENRERDYAQMRRRICKARLAGCSCSAQQIYPTIKRYNSANPNYPKDIEKAASDIRWTPPNPRLPLCDGKVTPNPCNLP